MTVELQPDIILIAETHLKQNVGAKVHGYTFFGRARTEGAGGGVGIFVNEQKKGVIAPHNTTREIEMSWVSIRRQKNRPVYIGIYYGKQETRVSKAEIENEMDLLREEIMEKQREGEVIIAMDGNGKVGILGEKISRNGDLLLRVFAETNLKLLNTSPKCNGRITRQNTKNKDECSAIDFVLCSNNLTENIQSMTIDEEQIHKISGIKDSDHNTIIVQLELNKIQPRTTSQPPVWRLNAPAEKWEDFRNALSMVHFDIQRNIETSLTDVFHNWQRCIEKIALNTIGKTTRKTNDKIYESSDLKILRHDRREAKKTYEGEKDLTQKQLKKEKYLEKQLDFGKRCQRHKR